MATQTRTPAPTDTPCLACGNALVLRRSGRSQRAFYGCRSYPACLYTRPHKEQATQLELPCTVSEAAALREQLSVLQGRCESADDYACQLEDEVRALRAERDAYKRDVDSLTFQLRATKFLLELQGDRSHTTTAAVPPWLKNELRKILALVHPDRWQGQPAETLAHEAAAAVNTLRSQLGEGH